MSLLDFLTLEGGLDQPEYPINYNFALLAPALQSIVSASDPVSITGGATLDAEAYGQMHVIAGSSANYTINLPTPATPDLGKVIGFRVAHAAFATKLYTLDAGATRTIAGYPNAQTRTLWKDEIVYLMLVGTTGVCWLRIGGALIPMAAQLSLAANQTGVASATMTKVNVATSDFDNASLLDTANKKIIIRRAGRYEVYGQVYYDSGHVISRAVVLLYKGGVSMGSDERYGALVSAPHPTRRKQIDLAAADEIELYAYQDSGASKAILGAANDDTCLGVREILSW
jgi:hypothetical protein